MTTAPGDLPSEESGHGVRIATVAGIPVYLAPSWFLIAAVIIGIVAGPVLDTRPLFGITVGVVQALLLLLSVLVHESAHALAARALGMPVLRIVANVWGGHTSYQAVRQSPGSMSVVALAGPLANVALALVALLGWAATADGLAHSLLQGLLIINGTLAAFNILPALPLDGGAALEALVWTVTGRRNLGTVVAGWSGRLLAVLVVGWFVVRPVLQGRGIGFDVFWGLFIASVLWAGASAAIGRGTALDSLERLRVQDVAEPAVVYPPGAPAVAAAAAAGIVVTTDERGVPVLYLGAPVPQGLDPSVPLLSVVTRLPDQNVVEAAPTSPLDDVLSAMGSTGVGVVVLTDQGRVWGATTVDRINRAASRN